MVTMPSAPYASRRTHLELPSDRVTRWLVALGLVMVLVAAGIVGGLIAGAAHMGSRTTTVVRSTPAGASLAAAPSGPWSATYALVAAGTVDITAQVTATVATPFGQREEQETALGSGFVLDGRGNIVTAAHVVDGASSIRVAFQNGAARSATIFGADDASDVALVTVDPAGLTLDPLKLGSSKALAVGDALALIGNPLGFDRSVSTGVVSGLDRTDPGAERV